MANDKNILASSIRNREHLAVYDRIAADRFDALPLEVLLVYLIDVVNAQALPILGEQFDVMGVKGWLFTQTEEDRRELIKKAIELQKRAGTPWSIKEALARAGYTEVTINERLTDLVQIYNGTILHDGAFNYGGDYHWAIFSVEIADSVSFTSTQWQQVFDIINTYKSVRCHLLAVTVTVDFEEEVVINEDQFAAMEGGFDYIFNFDLQ